jgi:ribosomal protein L20
MYESEKNLLEALADAIPGIKGYREKEARRDTDKRFREYLASRIEGARKATDEMKRIRVNKGKLEELDEIERLSQKLFKLSNAIRQASYGYSGFFDQVKIGEVELDRIYQYDLSLLGYVEDLETTLREDPVRTFEETMQDLEKRIKILEEKIEFRKNLFNIPS